MQITRKTLLSLYETAVTAVHPTRCLPSYIPSPIKGRTLVVAAGKASVQMAEVFANAYKGPFEGLLISHYSPDPTLSVLSQFEQITASHPIPNAAGQSAAIRALELATSLKEGDRLIVLLSGGASALLPAPCQGISLEDKIKLTQQLLACGASIQEINTVRQHCSEIKGGRLASQAAPAEVLTLAISDVVGDDPVYIASGPTHHTLTPKNSVEKILNNYQISLPSAVRDAILEREISHSKNVNTHYSLIASARVALNAVEEQLRQLGYTIHNLGYDLKGDAIETATEHANLITYHIAKKKVNLREGNLRKPIAFISGGELTAILGPATGRGGPNTEYLLSLYSQLSINNPYYALACDTDGKDGTGEAGALLTPDLVETIKTQKLNASQYIKHKDSYTFFDEIDGLVITGPTDTNVNDIRIILVH
ncbi:DUF4147 domain-containing protein [Temperatibacter marinus]|uniref:DUF4147 domain-containing protein n=1 Tax=Temperatibacter marinus TaxID=1456591 RepID=A0AA52EDH9_9PROT|nr:DUF4147 domain-containing protein [Temperatibacter marinus]WND02700.1 DUF4147 domain-containing protein [Temperatibacter marinus]